MPSSLGALVAFLLASTVSGCAASVVGAGVAAGVSGAGALAHDCSSYVTVTFRDARTGLERCGERVSAVSGERRYELTTCSYATLPEGTWQLSLEGGAATVGESELTVGPVRACQSAVYSVELA